MFKLLKENETRGNLSVREQAWMSERMQLKARVTEL